jgi:TonB family protein
MDILSLQEPTARPVARVKLAEAILFSMAIHLVAVFLVAPLPGWLPGPLLAFLRSRAVRPEVTAGPATPPPEAARAPEEKTRIPLKFAYVKVPDDRSVPPDRSAPLLSDRNRRARQEVPTPPSTRLFSRDPHSAGDTIDRVRPDPTRPEGPESIERTQTDGGAPSSGAGIGEADAGGRAAVARGEGVGAGPAGAIAGRETDRGAAGERAGADPAGTDLREALSNLQPGEYKFTFDNPAYLKDGSYGTMSFDTQDFPWGDYARQIYIIIRNNWFARLPLAFREGIRGYACWRFVIGKDGGVTRLLLVRTSSVPPFERAAADALRASSPLPPLPEEFPLDEEGVTFCFFYNMYPEEAE